MSDDTLNGMMEREAVTLRIEHALVALICIAHDTGCFTKDEAIRRLKLMEYTEEKATEVLAEQSTRKRRWWRWLW